MSSQFNKFGRVFQVYAQADAQFRLRPRDIENLSVRNAQGDMIPLGTMVKIEPIVGPPLISLYNLYPSSSVIGLPAAGFSSGEAIRLMEQNAAATLPPGTGTEWTAMSYQEKIVGNQMYFVFVMAMLLVYLVLAGQYESWYAPLAVILSVPLALTGPVLVLQMLRIDNNLYTQIGIILLIALSAKNAILIVEVAREHRVNDGKPILEAAVDAARARFRPILMTSFAFILGVAPLVDRQRRRRQRPQIDRHHRVLGHDRLDLPRRAVRSIAVRGDSAVRRMARLAQGAAPPAGGIAEASRRSVTTPPPLSHSHNLDAGRAMVGQGKSPTMLQPISRSTPAFVLALCVPDVDAGRTRARLAERCRNASRPARGNGPRPHRPGAGAAVPQSTARAGSAAPAGWRRRAADRGRAACFGGAVSSGRAVTASVGVHVVAAADGNALFNAAAIFARPAAGPIWAAAAVRSAAAIRAAAGSSRRRRAVSRP